MTRILQEEDAGPVPEVVICAAAGSPTFFPDNQRGDCALCSGPIIFRPDTPSSTRRICVACALSEWRARSESGRPQLTAIVSWVHDRVALRATFGFPPTSGH